MNPLVAVIMNFAEGDAEAHRPGDGSKVVVISVIQARPGPVRPGPWGTLAVVIDQWGQTMTIPWVSLTVIGPAPTDWTPEWLATL